MDLRKFCEFTGGNIDQFKPPNCFELAGEKIELEMDDGADTVLSFQDGRTLEWSIGDSAAKSEKYECLKADDTTYLVAYELENVRPRVCHTFVIDKENMLVTRIIASIGKNPKFPYLMTTEFEFGAIRRQGAETAVYPRHGYTSDLQGNILQWTYGGELSTVHVYYCTDFYRITYPSDRFASEEARRANANFNAALDALPSSDEPAVYVKIKEGMYLTSITEKNAEKLIGPKMMFRSNTLCFLQNYKRCYGVGRGFGGMTAETGDRDIFIMLGQYGKVLEPSEERLKKLLTDPNPYLV